MFAERGRGDHGPESYSMRLCRNTECHRTLWNRDVNAAVNILKLFLDWVEGRPKPPEFCRMRIDGNMVPPEASACMLWGGMSSCGLSTKTIIAKIDSCSAVLRTCSVEVVTLGRFEDIALRTAVGYTGRCRCVGAQAVPTHRTRRPSHRQYERASVSRAVAVVCSCATHC